jgi:type I restriction-modification system DNA methylase subunit
MLTGELRSQINNIWNAFWSGGISNPLEVIEQITYLLFLRRLDDLQMLEENKAARLKTPVERYFFPKGSDPKGRPYADFRWSHFKNFAPEEMFVVVSEHVFPFLRTLGGNDSTYSHHMADARFTIPTASLLSKVVDLIDAVPMDDRDTKGDLYEYMLSKIATAGQNGQFRTPRHIIRLMVEMTAPTPKDVICDPACGTCGFLMIAGEYLRERHPEALRDARLREHFHQGMFHGFDFDNTMLRIGSMNMLLHGVENPDVRYRDSLAQDHAGEEEKYTLVLANPPFSGSLDYENTAKDLLQIVKTKKTELLFAALFLRLLKSGGRAAVVVPLGVLASDSTAHDTLRRRLLDDNRLEAVIALPHWVFKPYASVATAILVFSKSGQTEHVWFYRVDNDGFDDGATKAEVAGSDLPEVLALWKQKDTESYEPRTRKHRFVNRAEIIDNGYDLSPNVYLRDYEYPAGIPLKHLDDLFDIRKGDIAATDSDDGEYPLITSSENWRRYTRWTMDGEAICVPLVSSTGHGHASLKRIHYVNGKFAAATIVAVMTPKPGVSVYVPYVYYYLFAHKDELLVPLMRGAANVSLAPERLGRLRIPVPLETEMQRSLVASLVQQKQAVNELKTSLVNAESGLEEGIRTFGSQY